MVTAFISLDFTRCLSQITTNGHWSFSCTDTHCTNI